MKRRHSLKTVYLNLLKLALITVFITTVGFAPTNEASAQLRLYRPPSHDSGGTVVLPAGTRVLPEGTILIVEMNHYISSKTARPGDRVRATVAVPVLDENGRTLVEAGSIVTGRVTLVKRARWANRAGYIAIVMDRINLRNGPTRYLVGTLFNLKDWDRDKHREEIFVKPGSSAGRSIAIVGGTTGTGATIGAITSTGALAGAGIGAVVGVSVALLIKGKNVVLEKDDRLGLELQKPLRVRGFSSSYYSRTYYNNGYSDYRTNYPCPPCPPYGRDYGQPGYGSPGYGSPGYGSPGYGSPGYGQSGGYSYPLSPQVANSGITVDVSDVRAERSNEGRLYIIVTARTPTTGWRIHTGYQVTGDTVNVTVRGVPPTRGSINQVSHPSAPPIVIPDNNGLIRRVSVEGANGLQTVSVYSSSTNRSVPPGPATSSAFRGDPSQMAPPRATNAKLQSVPALRPSSASLPLVEGSPRRIDSADLIDLIRQIREDFSESAELWIKQDGSYQPIGQKDPSNEAKQMLDDLKSLDQSVRAFAGTTDPNQRRTNGIRISEELRRIKETWQVVKMSPELNKKFRNLFQLTPILIGGYTD